MGRYRSVRLCQLRRYLQGLEEMGKLDAMDPLPYAADRDVVCVYPIQQLFQFIFFAAKINGS